MYKFLLCWRYLRTRYIALASIVSVTLGVATMIVVNSVMSGFSTEMQDRIHGILSDVIFESKSLEGFPDPEAKMARIREIAGDDIEAMTPVIAIPAMLNFEVGGEYFTRAVQLVGIDAATHGLIGDFSEHLQHPENREQLDFMLRHGGYDQRDWRGDDSSPMRPDMATAGWEHRRLMAEINATLNGPPPEAEPAPGTPTDPFSEASAIEDPFLGQAEPEGTLFDPATEQHTGVVVGLAIPMYPMEVPRQPGEPKRIEQRFVFRPGDDVILTFPTAAKPPQGMSDNFTVVDFYESKMNEYDSQFVFMPIEKLQQLRGMYDPATGTAMVNKIMIKLKPGVEGAAVRDKLSAAFRPDLYVVSTWRDKQGALLAAVQTETAILNVLLFLIIAVAGFGILAIFFMIVVEKTRDVGILKSLGAGSWGVMQIFLGYGLSLGLFGAGVGMVLGLLFVHYINQIAELIGTVTGREVFDPEIYYFQEIPAIVNPWTVAWIMLGAVAIAVAASVLPASRAARMHPVEALRYE